MISKEAPKLSKKISRTIIFKFPDKSRFSRIQPSGISILWPSFATTKKHNQYWCSNKAYLINYIPMTVPRRVTLRPK